MGGGDHTGRSLGAVHHTGGLENLTLLVKVSKDQKLRLDMITQLHASTHAQIHE